MTRLAAVALCLALAASQAESQGRAPDASQVEIDREIAADLQNWMKVLLVVPADLQIDAELREAMTKLVEEHLRRTEPMFRQWVSEERAEVRSNRSLRELQRVLNVRYVNELALWRLESPGVEYDAAMLPAILKPGICAFFYDRPYFAQQILLLQATTGSARVAALAGEREMLARWGQPRPNLPARAVPSQIEMETHAITQIRSGLSVGVPPLPPVLASRLLRDERPSLSTSQSCALHQWWLASALAKPGSRRDDALVAYRYAMAPLAVEWLPGPSPDVAGKEPPDAYPLFARGNGLGGTITLEVTMDAEGKFQRATVIGRNITIDGVRNTRPVAFETVFDDASIARAAKVDYPKPAASTVKNGAVTGRMDMVWKVE